MSDEKKSTTGDTEMKAARALTTKVLAIGSWTAKGFVTPTVADLYFAGKMADGDLVRSPPIPA